MEDTIGYSRFDDVSKQQDAMDQRIQLAQAFEMQSQLAQGVADGKYHGEAAEQLASAHRQVLEEQVKMQAQASWDYRKKMTPLRCGKLTMRQWDEYELWKKPQLSGNAFERNRGSGTLMALADTSWLTARCEAIGELYFNRIRWELPYRSSMAGIEAARVCYIGLGCPKSKCDTMGRPLGLRPPSLPVLKAGLVGLGLKEPVRSIELQQSGMISLTGRSHLELADLVILVTDDVQQMAELMTQTGLCNQLRERHRLGASILALGAACALLSLFDMCPFVIITDDHSAADKADLRALAKSRPAVELRPHAALLINTDGVSEPIGAVQLQNPNQPPLGMPNPPDETGMRIAYERWAQTWQETLESDRSDEPAKPAATEPAGPGLEADFIMPPECGSSKVSRKKAEASKAEGNLLFKAGDHAGALELYTSGSELDPTNQGILLNMAACRLKPSCLDPLKALLAANRALQLSRGRSAKAFYRRGLAFELMEDQLNAYHDFVAAKRLAPDDPVLQETCKQYYKTNIENPNEMTGAFQEAKEEFFYEHYQQLNPAYDAWEEGAHESAAVDRNSDWICARALWLWDKLLRGYSEGASIHAPTVHKPSTLRRLDVQLNLGADGVQFLCEGLRENRTLEHLGLRGCFIRTEGAQAVKNALIANPVLTSLDIGQNAIHDEGLRQIALGLADNKTLLRLNLSGNGIDVTDQLPAGLKQLCETLLLHSSLEWLDLSHNRLGTVGASKLLEALQYNMSLRGLSLIRVELEPHMVARMAGMVIDHHSLNQLDLRDNSVCVCTSGFIAARLQTLSVHKTIQLGAWAPAEGTCGESSLDGMEGAIVPARKLDFHITFPWEDFSHQLY